MFKIAVFVVACLAYANAAALHYAAAPAAVVAPAAVSTGTSSVYRSQDNIGNYAFGYNENHATGGSFRSERGDAAGNVAGSYGLVDGDGRQRVVNYVADAAGYRASIQTNEPGVEPKDPADVSINKAVVVAASKILLSFFCVSGRR